MKGLSLCRKSSLVFLRRAYAFVSSSSYCTDNNSSNDGLQNSRVKIFDRHLKRKQRDRAAWLMRPNDSFVDAVADNLLDRLEDCKRTFPTALFMGGSLEAIKRLLCGRGSIEKLIMMDISYDMIKLCEDAKEDANKNIETSFIVGDEEFLPIKERELRIACTVAQMEREGGISPRVSPLAQILKRETALATAAIYDSMFAAEDGTIPATFQVIYMTGWREHPSQQKAKRRDLHHIFQGHPEGVWQW
ncbi:hypothetical protein GH714_014124 [Hevea brasiliensis]|uniref:Methyltransferase type 11 domain-containing protein n=1 Tax=Hevea brasiliensis TaxID=3981 RepID=A0A6A6L8S4_HEVBR|nr:hypothetical protein GH714_014124 [Hevea brasiliensis]